MLDPFARHQHLAERMAARQMLVIDRMIVERGAEHHRRVMREPVQQVGLAEQADQIFLVALHVPEVVDLIGHADAVESRPSG